MITTSLPSAVAVRVRSALRVAAGLAVTPLVPGDLLELLDPLHPVDGPRARVLEVRPETRDLTTLVLRPGRGWTTHVPGQHVGVGVDVDGVRHWRTYSLTSSPQAPDGCLTIAVRTIPGGVVSTHLAGRARPGDVLLLQPPAGDFVLPALPERPALFVTAGSGITPVLGMLRSRLGDLVDPVLVHSSPTPALQPFRAELHAMAREEGLRLVERHTATEGRLSPTDLDTLVPDWAERDTWACGPAALLDALQACWDDHGVGDRLHVERFRPRVAATGEGGTVTFGRSARTVEVDGATPLLDAGEGAGVLLPSGCRMGICFGCVVPLRSGSVRDVRTGELRTPDEGHPLPVQTCINVAAGDCELDV